MTVRRRGRMTERKSISGYGIEKPVDVLTANREPGIRSHCLPVEHRAITVSRSIMDSTKPQEREPLRPLVQRMNESGGGSDFAAARIVPKSPVFRVCIGNSESLPGCRKH